MIVYLGLRFVCPIFTRRFIFVILHLIFAMPIQCLEKPMWVLQTTLDEYDSRCGKLECSLDDWASRCKHLACRHDAKITARKERWSMGAATRIMRKKVIFKPRRDVLRKEHSSMRDETIMYKTVILKPRKDVKVARSGHGLDMRDNLQ
jgi:hypothetical protein